MKITTADYFVSSSTIGDLYSVDIAKLYFLFDNIFNTSVRIAEGKNSFVFLSNIDRNLFKIYASSNV